MTSSSDAKRLGLEIVATLVNIKKVAVERLLIPAGVPTDLAQRFLRDRNSVTGEKLRKREAMSMVLEELDRRGENTAAIVAKLVGIAAEWTDFHLAMDEYVARGCVEKAKDMVGHLSEVEEAARADQERQRNDADIQRRQAAKDLIRLKSPLLLAQFQAAYSEENPQKRGYYFQELLSHLFTVHGFPVSRSFTRNEGGEQIDGAFEMDGWHYIVECRWRAKLADIRDLDGLAGQVDRSGRQTMGLFLSVNGWSENVIPLLRQSTNKSIFLMDGVDFQAVLSEQIDLRRLLKGKLSGLALRAEPYVRASEVA